jgi:hypothetical protein
MVTFLEKNTPQQKSHPILSWLVKGYLALALVEIAET